MDPRCLHYSEDHETTCNSMQNPSNFIQTTHPSPANSDQGQLHNKSLTRSSTSATSPVDGQAPETSWQPATPVSTRPFLPNSPSLAMSLATRGLAVDMGPLSSTSWRHDSFASYADSIPSTTISPELLHSRTSTAFSGSDTYDSEVSSSYQQFNDYSWGPQEYVRTPEPMYRDSFITKVEHDVCAFQGLSMYEPADGTNSFAVQACNVDPRCFSTNLTSTNPIWRPDLPRSDEMVVKHEKDSSPLTYGDFTEDKIGLAGDNFDRKHRRGGRRKKLNEVAKHVCERCYEPFSRTFNWKAHMQTHDPHRPRNFHCYYSTCGKAFFRPTDLKRHDQSVRMTLSLLELSLMNF